MHHYIILKVPYDRMQGPSRTGSKCSVLCKSKYFIMFMLQLLKFLEGK